MTIASMRRAPLAYFDSLEHIAECKAPDYLSPEQVNDFEMSLSFLQQYTGSAGTFNSYRRDLERLLQWCWHIALNTLDVLKRDDIENFIRLCQRPPAAWICVKTAPRFVEEHGQRTPNPEWRPFVATVSKSAFKKGQLPNKKDCSASNTGIKQFMAAQNPGAHERTLFMVSALYSMYLRVSESMCGPARE